MIDPVTAELMTFNIATTPIPTGEDHDEIATHLSTQLQVVPTPIRSKIRHGVTDRVPSRLAAVRKFMWTIAMCNVHMLSKCAKTAVNKILLRGRLME